MKGKFQTQAPHAGEEKKLVAELIDRPDQVARASRDEPEAQPDRGGSDRRSGITVEEITPDVRRQYRIPSETSGVVVTHVSQVSTAWEKGLREGDVIVQVNRRPVSSLEEYRGVVEPIKSGDLMTLYVVTPGVTAGRFITLRVGDE